LPEELLSLLLDAPSLENFTDEDLAKFPSQIRSYLYSWELVFASYPNASFKVRNDYSEVLKSENYITPLLDFLFDVLGHSAGQPLSLDKANFTSEHIRYYDDLSAQSDGGERNIQWLLINLYYLCLKFGPGLAKNWWMNCKSKQTRIAVESWTEKYFSPLVIADTMDEVATWASKQEPESEDEKELIVKVSKTSREVYAGCEIDDMQMQIVIRLPAAYPLEGVKVGGINRVAVSEKKWQSWLIVTQGVITFSVRHPLLSYFDLSLTERISLTDTHLRIYRTAQSLTASLLSAVTLPER
jgi:E3 ubiquitin-protein ligase listerin